MTIANQFDQDDYQPKKRVWLLPLIPVFKLARYIGKAVANWVVGPPPPPTRPRIVRDRRTGRIYIKYYAAALCVLYGLPDSAVAADIWCGHDDDENGSYTACTGNDKDHDGYTTDGAGSHAELVAITDIDCDDTLWQQSTNAWKDAGSGQVQRCKSDGTYTTAKDVSALTASDISSTCSSLKFLSATGATTAGCGAYGSPCDPRCLVDSGRACYVAPAAGSNDCFWWLPGTYTSVATAAPGGEAQMFYISNIDGTSAHPIINVADPTGTVLLDSPGTSSGTITKILRLDDSDYWKFYGFKAGNGFAGTAVWFNGGSDNEFAFGKVYSVNGVGGNNASGISLGGGSRNWIHQNLLIDNFDQAAPTNEDNAQIVAFPGTDVRISFNSIKNTSTKSFSCIKNKRSQANAPIEIIGNYCLDFWHVGIGWAGGGALIKRNYIKNTTGDNYLWCFDQHNWGGTPYYDSESKVWRNICVNGAMINSKPFESPAALGNPYLTLKYNILVDSSTTTAYDNGTNHPTYTFAYYTDQAGLDLMAGKFSTTSNGLYLSGGAGFKGAYGGGSGFGTAYSSFASWQAAGFDSGSFNEAITINSDGTITSSNSSTFGVFGDSGVTTTTASTTTTTAGSSTTTSIPANTERRFRGRGR